MYDIEVLDPPMPFFRKEGDIRIVEGVEVVKRGKVETKDIGYVHNQEVKWVENGSSKLLVVMRMRMVLMMVVTLMWSSCSLWFLSSSLSIFYGFIGLECVWFWK